MVKVQTEITDPIKDEIAKVSATQQRKYASLLALVNVIRPVLPKHGLYVRQAITADCYADFYRETNINDSFAKYYMTPNGGFLLGNIYITTLIQHESGEWQRDHMQFPWHIGSNLNIAQSYGSTVTYARRYSLSSIFVLAPDDDTDGEDLGTGIPSIHSDQSKQEKLATPMQINFLQSLINKVPSTSLQSILEKEGKNKVEELSADRISKHIEHLKERISKVAAAIPTKSHN